MRKTVHKLFLGFTMLVTTVSSVLSQVEIPEDRENFHIFLLMGQSNMSGNAILSGMDTSTDPRILKFNRGNGWELARDPVTNLYDPAVGPGMAFAKRLLEENPDITIGLVSTAMGGTKISEWSRGSGLYFSSVWRASLASHRGVIKGVLWHQGEHDAIYASDASVYGNRLNKLADDLRRDLGNPELPFIVGGFAPSIIGNKNHIHAATVWNRLKRFGETYYKAAYVPTYEVSQLNDRLHFDSTGQREMGRRYADAYLALTGHWNERLKALLDADATPLPDGWKTHPVYGTYYDANFPILKHAQLEWFRVNVNAQQLAILDSTEWGKIAVSPESFPNGLYLHRQVDDPERRPFERGDEFYVNTHADGQTENVFYNHTTNEWSRTLDESPEYTTILDAYLRAERQFIRTQEATLQTRVAAMSGNWSETRRALEAVEWNRFMMITYSVEAWNVIGRSGIPRNEADIWRARVMDIIERIDGVLIEAQEVYVALIESGVTDPVAPPPPDPIGPTTPVDPDDPDSPEEGGVGDSWENPIVLGSVIAPDAMSWPENIVLAEVRTNEPSQYRGRSKVSFPSTKPTKWEEVNIGTSASPNWAAGNFWVVQKVGEKYYATTMDYFRPNAFFNEWAPGVFSEHLPPEASNANELSPMFYEKGATYGLIVTTPARRSYRTTNERSNVVFFEMP